MARLQDFTRRWILRSLILAEGSTTIRSNELAIAGNDYWDLAETSLTLQNLIPFDEHLSV